MSPRLAGRTAVVTGVSRRSGIGYAIAHRLASAGADVLVQSWRPHDLEQPWGGDPDGPEGVVARLRQGLPPGSGRVEHVEADLADAEAPAALVAEARRRFGPVAIVVANHARSSAVGLAGLTAAELDLCWAVNARATLLLVQAFAAQPDLPPSGRVVTFTSGQHLEPMPGELPYAVTKGAVQQATASLAAALAPRGVTVNCVNPGPTDTGWADAVRHADVAARFPAGRWGTPDDAARVVEWLVGDDGRWVTGQTLVSDGGFSLTR